MTELITTLVALLTAETGVGELLEGLTIRKNEHEGVVTNCCVVRRGNERRIQQLGRVKKVDGRVFISTLMAVDKVIGTGDKWETAAAAAETWARKVEKVIMRNPNLVLAPTYPNGFTAQEQETEVENIRYGFGVDNSTWYAFAEMELKVHYLYRDGAVALEQA